MGRGASAGGAAVPGLPLTAGTDYRMVLGQTFRDGAEKGASRDTSGQNGATAGAEPNRSRKRKRREPTDPAEATFTELAYADSKSIPDLGNGAALFPAADKASDSPRYLLEISAVKDHTPRHRLGTNADLDGRDFVLLLDRTTDPPTLVLERLGCRIENLDIKGAQKAAEKRKKTAERRQKESTMNKGPSPGKSGSPPPVEASSSGATKGDVVEYSEASDDESEVPAVVVSGPVGDSRPEHRASKSSFHLAPPSKPGLLGSPAKPSPSSPYPSVILTPASSQTSDKSHELDLESFASELENDLSQKGSDLEDEALPLMAKDRTTKGRSKLSASQVIVEDLDIASDPDAAGTPVRQPEPETEPAGRTGGKTVASLDATYERMSTGGKSVASLTKLHGGPRTLGGSDDDESSDDDD